MTVELFGISISHEVSLKLLSPSQNVLYTVRTLSSLLHHESFQTYTRPFSFRSRNSSDTASEFCIH